MLNTVIYGGIIHQCYSATIYNSNLDNDKNLKCFVMNFNRKNTAKIDINVGATSKRCSAEIVVLQAAISQYSSSTTTMKTLKNILKRVRFW